MTAHVTRQERRTRRAAGERRTGAAGYQLTAEPGGRWALRVAAATAAALVAGGAALLAAHADGGRYAVEGRAGLSGLCVVAAVGLLASCARGRGRSGPLRVACLLLATWALAVGVPQAVILLTTGAPTRGAAVALVVAQVGDSALLAAALIALAPGAPPGRVRLGLDAWAGGGALATSVWALWLHDHVRAPNGLGSAPALTLAGWAPALLLAGAGLCVGVAVVSWVYRPAAWPPVAVLSAAAVLGASAHALAAVTMGGADVAAAWADGRVQALLAAALVLAALSPWVGTPTRRRRPERALAPAAALVVGHLLAGAGLVVVVARALLGRAPDHPTLVLGGAVLLAVVLRELLAVRDTQRLNRALQSREDHYRTLVQGSTDVIMITDHDGRVRYASPAIEHGYGYPPESVVGRWATEVVHPDDLDDVRGAIRSFLAGTARSVLMVCRVKDSAGRWRPTESTVSRRDDGLIVVSRDVSDRAELEAKLAHFAMHDVLTGLANRALFAEHVAHAVGRLAADGAGPAHALAVLVVDLDDFKAVNDAAGHGAGDLVIVEAAKRLVDCVPQGETLARFGGDEFAVLLERGVTRELALDVAERMLGVLAEPFHGEGLSEVALSATIGVAFSSGVARAEDLVRNADLALHRAKASGKGRAELYDPAMHAAVVRRVELGSRLRRALDEREFTLLYQPVVDLASGSVAGVEALIRWRPGDGQLVTPAELLELAEDSGRIVPLGRWVLDEAVRQVARWRRGPEAVARSLTMAVNLSARQLETEGLVAAVEAALDSAGVPPEVLTLEVTESTLLEDLDAAGRMLARVRERGVRVAIDDFGTGYSSLAYLQRLPVDILKIDRSFVTGLGVDSDATALVATIVRLGLDLSLTIVAEGVERAEQAVLLRELGVHRAQGFWFSGPLEASGVRTVLREHVFAPDQTAARASGRPHGETGVPTG